MTCSRTNLGPKKKTLSWCGALSVVALVWSAAAPVSRAQPLYATSSDTMTSGEALQSQQGSYRRELPMWTFGYSMALGVGDLNDYVQNVSFRGFEVNLLWPLARSLFVGASFGYNGFYESTGSETYQLASAAVTGKLYRYADAWPLAAVGRYVFAQPESMFRPYLGLQMGATWIQTTTLVTDLTFQDSQVGFLLAPEAGILAHLSKAVAACLAYKFNFTTASPGDRDLLSYSSLMLGLTLQP